LFFYIIHDATFIHNFIDKLGFNVGEKVLEKYINAYHIYLENIDDITDDSSDDF